MGRKYSAPGVPHCHSTAREEANITPWVVLNFNGRLGEMLALISQRSASRLCRILQKSCANPEDRFISHELTHGSCMLCRSGPEYSHKAESDVCLLLCDYLMEATILRALLPVRQ